jgi:hypothetical protein
LDVPEPAFDGGYRFVVAVLQAASYKLWVFIEHVLHSKCNCRVIQLDARQLGLNTHVIVDGCRGIELEAGDIDGALDDMKRAGAVLLKSSDL